MRGKRGREGGKEKCRDYRFTQTCLCSVYIYVHVRVCVCGGSVHANDSAYKASVYI